MPPESNMNYKQMALAVEVDDAGHQHHLYQDLATAREILRERNKDGFPNVWQNFLFEVNKEIKAHPDSDAAKMLKGLEICGLDSCNVLLLRDKDNHRRLVRDPLSGPYAVPIERVLSEPTPPAPERTNPTPESTKPRDSQHDRPENRDKASSIMQQAVEQNRNSSHASERTQGLQWRSTPFSGDQVPSPSKRTDDNVMNQR